LMLAKRVVGFLMLIIAASSLSTGRALAHKKRDRVGLGRALRHGIAEAVGG
jgi:hypothetical protein